MIENKTEVKQFLDGLATANALYIQIRSLDKGGTSAEFRVADAQRGIDLLAANCEPNNQEEVRPRRGVLNSRCLPSQDRNWRVERAPMGTRIYFHRRYSAEPRACGLRQS